VGSSLTVSEQRGKPRCRWEVEKGYGRGGLVVFTVPEAAEVACGSGGTNIKRIIGVPGDVWQEKQGFVSTSTANA